MKQLFHALIPLMACLVLAGCETTKSPPPAPTKISCLVPEIMPLPETKETQEKGGLEISIAPATYTAVLTNKVTYESVQPSFDESMQIAMMPPEKKASTTVAVKTITPSLFTSPDQLSFLVKINNKMSRVFRGAGTVVQFNAAGKLLAVDQTGYGEMLAAIVPPRTELQLTVRGPKLDTLGNQGTLGLFFYDVVTAVDAAGNVTEKQNYQWFFNFTNKVVEQSAEITKERGFITQ